MCSFSPTIVGDVMPQMGHLFGVGVGGGPGSVVESRLVLVISLFFVMTMHVVSITSATFFNSPSNFKHQILKKRWPAIICIPSCEFFGVHLVPQHSYTSSGSLGTGIDPEIQFEKLISLKKLWSIWQLQNFHYYNRGKVLVSIRVTYVTPCGGIRY